MKLRVIILWLISAAFLGLALWAVSYPYGYLFAALHRTSEFWVPLWLLISCGCAAGALFTRRKMRRGQGKKGTVPTVFGVLFLVLAVAEGYVTVSQLSLKPEFSTLTQAAAAPDGKHSLWRVKHSDMLGNTCYNYYQQVSTFRWAYAFDDDSDEVPEITWGDTGFLCCGKSCLYQPEADSGVIGPCP